LQAIAGLLRPDAGHVRIDGRTLFDAAARIDLPAPAREVGFLFQNYALFPHLSVRDNVAFGLRSWRKRRLSPDEAARVQALLDSFGLTALADSRPRALSGGQQQRVALARALVLEPAVLLFDEPLSNLDARLRREMREEIRSIQQRLKLTVAYVTHDQSEALAVSDQIIVMDHGVIAQRGTPEQLYGRPESEFVAGFMGEAMVFPATATPDGQVAMGPLTLTPRHAVASGAVKVAVRPEAWLIGVPGGLPATLRKAAYLGGFYEYGFDTSIGPVFVVSSDLERPLAAGAHTTLTLGTHGVSVVPGG
ncbi:MAG: ABC transporter ATP-binding protein, partial [Comamonadaceae bacterium]